MNNNICRSLDLGCGNMPRNPYNADEVFGVDVRDNVLKNIRAADLAVDAIPFEDNFFDFVTAFDFLEHIPRLLYVPKRRNAFVEVMNEIYRVLKVGGLFLSYTPAYPHAPVFRDPTHVNFITEETFSLYFGDVYEKDQYCWASMYGFKGAFRVTFQQMRGPHLLSVMKKLQIPELRTEQSSRVADESLNLEKAIASYRLGHYSEAVKLLWENHINATDSAEPLYWLSKIFLETGNPSEALRISTHAVNAVTSLYPHLWLMHSMSLHALGKDDLALVSLERALEINPDYKDALMKKSQILTTFSLKT